MLKRVFILLLAASALAQTKIDLATQVKGQLQPSFIQPGVAGQCLVTVGSTTTWTTCPGGGGGGGYSTIQSAGVALAQQATLNFLGALSCVNDAANSRTNCQLTTPITVSQGGTGLATLAIHQLYVGNGTSVPNAVATGNTGQVLISNGASADPSFADPVVSQPTASLLNATVVQGTGTNLHTVVDNFPGTQPVSGTVSTTPPANASTNVTQFGGTNISTGTGAGGLGIPRVTLSSDSGVLASGVQISPLATWTSATTLNTVVTPVNNNFGFGTCSFSFIQTTTITGGAAAFETSVDGNNWFTIGAIDAVSGIPVPSNIYTFQASTNKLFQVDETGYSFQRIRLSTAITGTGTVTIASSCQSVASPSLTTVYQAPGNWLTQDASDMTGTVPGTAPGFTGIAGGIFNSSAPAPTNGQTLPLQLDGSGNLNVNVKAGGAGGTSSSFAAAFPATGTAIGVKNGANMVNLTADGSGNLDINCTVGCGISGDQSTGSTALGALNAVITVPLAGESGVAFQLQSGGTGIYTVTPQCSYDGGTIYNTNGYIQDPFTGVLSTTATIASAQVTTDYPVLCPSGASHAQMKVTAYTSGTANWLARSTVVVWPPMVWGIVTTNAPSYTAGQINAISLDPSGLLRVSLKDTPSNTNNFNVNLAASAATVTTAPPSNASTNVTQFGGTNISTGTGVGGAGIPRVTVSSDSFPATQPVSGTVTAVQASGANLHVNCDSGCAGASASATFISGQVTVSTTPTALPSNTTKNVCITAASANGERVYLGGATVSPTTGDELSPGVQKCYPVNNSNLIFLVGLSTGESVTWAGTN